MTLNPDDGKRYRTIAEKYQSHFLETNEPISRHKNKKPPGFIDTLRFKLQRFIKKISSCLQRIPLWLRLIGVIITFMGSLEGVWSLIDRLFPAIKVTPGPIPLPALSPVPKPTITPTPFNTPLPTPLPSPTPTISEGFSRLWNNLPLALQTTIFMLLLIILFISVLSSSYKNFIDSIDQRKANKEEEELWKNFSRDVINLLRTRPIVCEYCLRRKWKISYNLHDALLRYAKKNTKRVEFGTAKTEEIKKHFTKHHETQKNKVVNFREINHIVREKSWKEKIGSKFE